MLKEDLIPSIPVRSNEDQSNLTTMGRKKKMKEI